MSQFCETFRITSLFKECFAFFKGLNAADFGKDVELFNTYVLIDLIFLVFQIIHTYQTTFREDLMVDMNSNLSDSEDSDL